MHAGWLLLAALLLKGFVLFLSARVSKAKENKDKKPGIPSKYAVLQLGLTPAPASAKKIVVIGGAGFHGRCAAEKGCVERRSRGCATNLHSGHSR